MTLPQSVRARVWWRQPSAAMCLVLALSIVAYPFADETRGLRPLAQLLDVAVVLMVVRMIRSQAETWRSGWVIAIPTVLLQAWHLAAPQTGVELPMLLAQVVFHGYAALVLLAYVLMDEVITLDEKLFAIAGVYMLLGLLWAKRICNRDPLRCDRDLHQSEQQPGRVAGFGDLVYYSADHAHQHRLWRDGRSVHRHARWPCCNKWSGCCSLPS